MALGTGSKEVGLLGRSVTEMLVTAGGDINSLCRYPRRQCGYLRTYRDEAPVLYFPIHQVCREINQSGRHCSADWCRDDDHKAPMIRMDLLRFILGIGANPHLVVKDNTAMDFLLKGVDDTTVACRRGHLQTLAAILKNETSQSPIGLSL